MEIYKVICNMVFLASRVTGLEGLAGLGKAPTDFVMSSSFVRPLQYHMSRQKEFRFVKVQSDVHRAMHVLLLSSLAGPGCLAGGGNAAFGAGGWLAGELCEYVELPKLTESCTC